MSASVQTPIESRIVAGGSLGKIELDLTLQRLIMIAGANRDFALSHSDNETARFGGAPAAYGDSMFVFTMFERLLLQWGGPLARIKALGPLNIRDFVVCGKPAIAQGVIEQITEVEDENGAKRLEVTSKVEIVQNDGRVPVFGLATVSIPHV